MPSPQAALDMLGLVPDPRRARDLTAYEMLNKLQLDIVLDSTCRTAAPPISLPTMPWHVLVELAGTGGAAPLDEALQEVLERKGWKPAFVSRCRHCRFKRGTAGSLVGSAAQRDRGQQEGRDGDHHRRRRFPFPPFPPSSNAPRKRRTASCLTRRSSLSRTLGDGNVHFIPAGDPSAQWEAWGDPHAMALRIKHAVNEVAHELGGTFSAEHGIGQALTEDMLLFKSPTEIDLMRAIKSIVDPYNLFNPGRLLPASVGALNHELLAMP